MKDYMSEAENIFNDLFKKKPTESDGSTGNV